METLTVYYLARELDALWRGRRVSSFSMRSDLPAVTLGAVGAPSVRFDLSRPECRAYRTHAENERGPLDGFEIEGVEAPIDDRAIIVRLVKPGKFRGSAARRASLTISVVPNSRGAVLAGDRDHRYASVGSKAHAPKAPRSLLTAEELREAARAGGAQALMQGRWVGPAVARWLLSDPERIVDRYAEIAALPPARPSRCGDSILPHPLCEDPVPVDSLLEPEPEHLSAATKPEEEDEHPNARAIARMRAELERSAQAPLLRAAAARLMAMSPDDPVPPSLPLPDGTAFEIQAKATETPHTVAERLFAKARSMERARLTLPDRIAKLESRGTEQRSPATAARRDRSAPTPRVPYKQFISRGGLEIRVGKSAKDNDDLTFHHSSPDDVWMHARDSAGSHVVLRWTDAGAPPASDLEEAAILAAWHSQSRGSTVVPVDWTRRKHVRKPRGASPGSVLVSRAKTVMVRPTAETVRAIRDRS